MKIDIKMDKGALKKLSDAQVTAVKKTAEQLRSEIIESRTIPFDTGHMQNTQTYVDVSSAKSGNVKIVTDTPYASRLYYHPEYNFDKTTNENARGLWWDPYLNGSLKDRPKKIYRKALKVVLQKGV